MDPHPRLAQLESWVQRIRDGHCAALWLTRPFPEGDVGWISVPIVVWRDEPALAKFEGHLRPIPVACNLSTGVYAAGFSARRECRTGSEVWRERFEVSAPMSHRQMRARLRQLVSDGDQARYEVIEWSRPYREKHTKRASAGLSLRKGVSDGFLFDQADLRHVADELIEVVLDQFDRYAGIRRTDRHGKDLVGRPGMPVRASDGSWTCSPPYDLEHQVKEYLRSRSRRCFARVLGCSEKELAAESAPDPAWMPVARSCEYISDVDATAVVALPADDTRPAPRPVLAQRARKAFQLLESNGGVHAVATMMLKSPRTTPRRAVRALLCPWGGNLEELESTVRYLAGRSPEQAMQDWCDALHWWVSSDEPAPLLRCADVESVAVQPRVAVDARGALEDAGGVSVVARQVLAGSTMPARLVAALRAPWPCLNDQGFVAMVDHLVSQSEIDAETCWVEAMQWSVTAGEALVSLPGGREMVDVYAMFCGLLPDGQLELVAA